MREPVPMRFPLAMLLLESWDGGSRLGWWARTMYDSEVLYRWRLERIPRP